jgi:phosphomannomutase
VRVNLHLSGDAQARVPERLRGDVKELGGRRVARTDRIDGLRLTFDDGAWVLIRPSGTEPLVRIYTESGSAAKSQVLAEEARVWITQ